MVERPIKKSERQTENPSTSSDATPQASDSKPSAPPKPQRSSERSDDRPSGRSDDRPAGRNDRSSGRGKRGSQDDEPKQMMNPALMRGPKPVKAPIAPEPQPEAIEETTEETTEAAIGETTEA